MSEVDEWQRRHHHQTHVGQYRDGLGLYTAFDFEQMKEDIESAIETVIGIRVEDTLRLGELVVDSTWRESPNHRFIQLQQEEEERRAWHRTEEEPWEGVEGIEERQKILKERFPREADRRRRERERVERERERAERERERRDQDEREAAARWEQEAMGRILENLIQVLPEDAQEAEAKAAVLLERVGSKIEQARGKVEKKNLQMLAKVIDGWLDARREAP